MAFHLSFICLISICFAAFYKFYIYPAFISPLAKVPNAHWSCSFCPIWILWMRWTDQENRTVHAKHMQLGVAVRLAPNMLSLNCFEGGLKQIYQEGFPKPDFYSRGFAFYGRENLFTFKDNATHSQRKRIISNTFSKSFIMSSETARASIRDILFGRYLPILQKAAVEVKPVEMLELNYAYSMDVFVQWQFGRTLSSNLVEDLDERRLYLDGWFDLSKYAFWQYEFPSLAKVLRKVGIFLVPKGVDAKFHAIEDWNLQKCDRAQQLLVSQKNLAAEDQPVVFEHAIKAMSTMAGAAGAYPRRLEIASDMFNHSNAAFETSGNTETYLFYEMCRNPGWQTRLRQEVSTLHPSLTFISGRKVEIHDLPDPKAIDALPILHAIIMETLRLWPTVPGGQPRVVPKSCSLGGYRDIPKGTVVQCYAYSLHRNSEVFHDPNEWKPERWLNASPEELANMKKWFWAFSSGARMCIGSHFAFYSMKFLLASVYANFTTSIHDHGTMELMDAYLAGPKGRRLGLMFHPV